MCTVLYCTARATFELWVRLRTATSWILDNTVGTRNPKWLCASFRMELSSAHLIAKAIFSAFKINCSVFSTCYICAGRISLNRFLLYCEVNVFLFFPTRCYNCNEHGHHAKNCPEPPLPKRCHHCKSEDHLVADCPDKPAQSSQGSKSADNDKEDCDTTGNGTGTSPTLGDQSTSSPTPEGGKS